MSLEFELKLLLPVRAAAAFRKDRLLASLATGPVRTRRLRTIYFDTPDRLLATARIALRVRRVGRRWVQTIKLPAGIASANVHEELERDVNGPVPALDQAEFRILKRQLGETLDPALLAPVFETDFRRTTWPLRFKDTTIELAHDAGRIVAGGRSERLAEIELELVDGNPGRLFELALDLLERHPLRFEPRTKAERGYALADGRSPTPVIAAEVTIRPDMTVREALATTVESCLAHYHANSLVLQSRNAEGIHQMRVALRRLRALVSACAVALAPEARAFLAEELRWLQQQFGPARDWDVFIAETLEPMIHRLPNDPDLPVVRRAAETRREDGYRQARDAIGDPHHVRVLLRIGQWLATGDWVLADGEVKLEDFAAERLHERHRKVRKFGKALDLPIAELHQLRIAAKKMRYVAEFFRPIYPKKASKPFFAALKDLQDDLGSINDAVVTERLMDDLEPRVARRIGLIRAARARSLLTGWQAQRVERDLAQFRRVWDRFRACDPFWPKPPRRPGPTSAPDGADAIDSLDAAPFGSNDARGNEGAPT